MKSEVQRRGVLRWRWVVSASVCFALGSTNGFPSQQQTSPVPSVQQLVSRVDQLDEKELMQLSSHGDAAWRLLFPIVQERLLEWRQADLSEPKGAPKALQERLERAIQALGAVMNPRHTSELFRLMSLVKMKPRGDYSPSGSLYSVLIADPAYVYPPGQGGHPDRVVPLCLSSLKSTIRTPIGTWDPLVGCLRYLKESHHPEAVRFWMEILKDPAADLTLRRIAYTKLADTGGKPGLKKVLALRDRRRTLPTLRDLIGLDGIDQEGKGSYPPESGMVRTERDPQGSLWGWLAVPFGGAYRDRWLLKYEGERWGDPVLATTPKRGEEGNSEWLERYAPHTAELARDTDCDGWSNRLEERFGTDPYAADTDRDGLRDSADRNPLAAPRPLLEREQILAAAFEACFHFFDSVAPCVMELPEGMKPFELAGWKGVILTTSDWEKSPLAKVWPEGVGHASFGPQSEGYSDSLSGWGKDDGLFHWNASRTEVRVALVITYHPRVGAGYNLRLRKFGEEWVVVDWRVAFLI